MTATEKVIDKLRKLRNASEGERAIGNEAAANAFAEMLNKLLLDNKLEMTDIEFEEMEREQPVGKHYVDYERHGVKLKRQRVKWMETLAHVIASAHFCRFLVHPGSSRITFVGRKDDCEVVEYMFVTLLRATETLADNAYDEIVNVVLKRCGICKQAKTDRCHKPQDEYFDHPFEPDYLAARGYRPAFIDGFIERLHRRFTDLRRARETESTALVRLNKAEGAIKDFMNQKNGRKKVFHSSQALSRQTRWNSVGREKGRAAADAINLGANAIKSGNPVKAVLR